MIVSIFTFLSPTNTTSKITFSTFILQPFTNVPNNKFVAICTSLPSINVHKHVSFYNYVNFIYQYTNDMYNIRQICVSPKYVFIMFVSIFMFS